MTALDSVIWLSDPLLMCIQEIWASFSIWHQPQEPLLNLRDVGQGEKGNSHLGRADVEAKELTKAQGPERESGKQKWGQTESVCYQ